jgi:hypothetical protein
MAKQNNKITPQVYKQLESLSKELPQFQRKNTDGSLMYRSFGKRVSGYDVPKADRETIKDFDVKKYYSQKGQEPVLVNHSVNLRNVYQKEGQTGVDAYCNFFKSEHEKQTIKTKAFKENENNIITSK